MEHTLAKMMLDLKGSKCRTARSIFDRIYRHLSDVLFVGVNIHGSGPVRLRVNRWTAGARDLYMSLEGSHKVRMDSRTGKKLNFTLEHEVPIEVMWQLLDTFENEDDVLDFMNEYGHMTIVTADENKRLVQSVKTLEEASKRYADAGISIITEEEYLEMRMNDVAGRRKSCPTEIVLNDGEILHYDSLQAASRDTGIPTLKLLGLIDNKTSYDSPGGRFVQPVQIKSVRYL